MRIGTLLLCRYSSSRLPGKILRHLGDKSILQQIYDKLLLVVPRDSIVVTTSEAPSDDIIQEYCEANNMNVFRGSLDNVAGRFLAAAQAHQFDFITRINGDAPFINMNMYAKMLVACRTNKYDFISNVSGRTWPVGMSAETVRVSFYESLQQEIQSDPLYFEHVTSYLYANPELGNRYYIKNTRYPELRELHLAVDEQKDFDFAQRIYKALGDRYPDADFDDYAEAVALVKSEYEARGIEWTHSFNRKKLMSDTKHKA